MGAAESTASGAPVPATQVATAAVTDALVAVSQEKPTAAQPAATVSENPVSKGPPEKAGFMTKEGGGFKTYAATVCISAMTA